MRLKLRMVQQTGVAMAKKNKYYAVAAGKVPGIYTQWFGPKGAEIQVRGFAGARYKGFSSLSEAKQFIETASASPHNHHASQKRSSRKRRMGAEASTHRIDENGKVVIYTDGGALNNPGPGGYGVVITNKGKSKELSKGFRLTTNNRMELLACIEGLKAVPTGETIVLYSDSKYVVDGITKGWAKRWRDNGWMRTKNEPAINADLWSKLLKLNEKRKVTYCWVKGHAGIDGNERCDVLATTAASGSDLGVDAVYEKSVKR